MLKTFLLALLLFGTAQSVFAQAAPVPNQVPALVYQHCILVSKGEYHSGTRVSLEYGQNSKAPAKDAELAQADVAVRKLGSIVAALNYMSSQGWECVGANTVMSGVNTSSGSIDAEVGYLLRRPAR